ncbi:MAG: type II toxin-antitoxin system VapC family toxin [Prosthecobacter sp.]|uniref:type II toxin-antitoxin system VapC family toxin n=1 Tax=Prosthecobacter sp. TaxID=1965333 RepID=UPI0038FF7797
MICADTSFLISYYGDDVNSEVARAHMAKAAVLNVHAVNDFEFANALRLLVFRGKITATHRASWLETYHADIQRGALISEPVALESVFEEAEEISTKHAETGGHRAYDILQVAAALLLGATDFWSFDGKQRQLAAAEGMSVGP